MHRDALLGARLAREEPRPFVPGSAHGLEADDVLVEPRRAGNVAHDQDAGRQVRGYGVSSMGHIEISETAARKIRTLMSKQGIDDGGLRVGVKGGGKAATSK